MQVTAYGSDFEPLPMLRDINNEIETIEISSYLPNTIMLVLSGKTDSDDKKFIELLDKIDSKEKPYRIISKIDIVSPGGIQNTKEILNKAIQTINFNYYLVYDTAPTFKFESSSIESSDDDHKNFIKFLETEGQKLNPKTFIRCNSIVHV
jgi:hypothetical protein